MKYKPYIPYIIFFAFYFLFVGLLAQAQPKSDLPANDIERGVFVHYPHAKGQAGGGSATGDQVNDYKYSGIHWSGQTPTVNYKINPVNSLGLLEPEITTTVESAFQEWMNNNPADSKYIRFVDTGLTDLDTPANPTSDGVNTVSFEPLNSAYPNAIAITFFWYSRGSKTLIETDTVFNSDLPWSTSGDFASYDLQNIATHEFGHWLVLGDLYSLRDSALTMYGYGGLGETSKRDLGRGDITGINKIY